MNDLGKMAAGVLPTNWQILSHAQESISRISREMTQIWLAPCDSAAMTEDPPTIGLSATEWARADRYRVAKARRQFLQCRTFMRWILAQQLDVEPGIIVLDQPAQQKPFLAGPFLGCGLDFNLSHTDGWMMLGVTWHGRIGVDCERVRAVAADDLVSRFFASEEQPEWARIRESTAEKDRSFYHGWTRKESYVKAFSRSVQDFANFAITLDEHTPARVIRPIDDTDGVRTITIESHEVQPGIIAAVTWAR